MRRREFIGLMGAAVLSWPRVAISQQVGKVPTIGFLGTVTQSEWPVEAFDKRLRELGWIEGRTITIEYRWAEGREERITEFVAEFVRSKVDVIVTGGNAVSAAKQATSTIPIVFAVAADALGSGFVDSLARPGGNVTGLTLQSPELVGKRLNLLREVLPGRRRLAVMANVGYPAAKQELAQVEATAGALGFEVAPVEIRRTEDVAPAFETLKSQIDALYVVADALISANHSRIITSASGCRRSSHAIMPKRVRSCPMDQNSQLYSGAPLSMWTRFCAGPSPAISQSSSRLNSIPSSISPPRGRSGSKCHTTSSCWPTR